MTEADRRQAEHDNWRKTRPDSLGVLMARSNQAKVRARIWAFIHKHRKSIVDYRVDYDKMSV